MFGLPFLKPKPSHTEVRYVVPTRREQTEAQRQEANRRASINGQLAVYNATTSIERRQRDTEAYFASVRSPANKDSRRA